MKVLLINGSPNKNGCTNRALKEIAATLEENGITGDILWIGNSVNGGCMGCGYCRKNGKCVQDDVVNTVAAMLKDYDGFVFGSAVHFAGVTGNMTSFMDRLFYSCNRNDIRLKPAAIVTSARRAGNTATFDQLIKYPTISEMPVISSTYWNNVHGFTSEDVEKDEEGLQTMRNLARNLSFFLKSIALAKQNGMEIPANEKVYRTNFID